MFSQDCEQYGLEVSHTGTTRRLIAGRGFKENDTVMDIKALLFGSSRATADFLNLGGNAALLDGPLMQIQGLVYTGEDPESCKDSSS